MAKNTGISYGLLIPIVVLFIVMFSIGERWLLFPIGVLLIIFIADTFENSRIEKKQEQVDYWKSPESKTHTSGTYQEPQVTLSKPIYDQKKQKEQGVNCGIFIPIFIIGWLYYESRSWVFLIPLFFLFIGLAENISQSMRGKSRVREQIKLENIGTVSDVSSRTGLTEEKVREHIVTEKRSGSTNVWFDPSSGEITHMPVRDVEEPVRTSVGCPYCGFALKSEDRFCPFCGAPIRVST
ncbi:MAG: zinc ribbon domain-containing protein [Candidatus Thorarchaeota archaeon]|nr:zinc ribbon domain-containing protein [Candidatus Thorarchaeota archaeon]